jgi:hypothetical protein
MHGSSRRDRIGLGSNLSHNTVSPIVVQPPQVQRPEPLIHLPPNSPTYSPDPPSLSPNSQTYSPHSPSYNPNSPTYSPIVVQPPQVQVQPLEPFFPPPPPPTLSPLTSAQILSPHMISTRHSPGGPPSVTASAPAPAPDRNPHKP